MWVTCLWDVVVASYVMVLWQTKNRDKLSGLFKETKRLAQEEITSIIDFYLLREPPPPPLRHMFLLLKMVGAFACIDFHALPFSVSVSLSLLKEDTFPQPGIQFPAAAGCVHVSTFTHIWTRTHAYKYKRTACLSQKHAISCPLFNYSLNDQGTAVTSCTPQIAQSLH